MNSKRLFVTVLACILALLFMVTPVLAMTPHFGKTSVKGPGDDGSLTVDFNANGVYYPPLGVNVNGTRDTIFACKLPDENFPLDPITQEVIDSAVGGAVALCEHSSCKGSIVIPPPGTSLICEGNMAPYLAMITYSDLNIYGIFGDLHGFQKKINGIYSATYYGYTP
jgi:hypothetical protein